MDEFKRGTFSTIDGKPYLVYDIETTVCDDIRDAEYLLGYAMYPVEDNKMEYEYVGKENIEAFKNAGTKALLARTADERRRASSMGGKSQALSPN
jgi:hypothetical protein